MSARRTVGVTGDIGCGKTTVLDWLAAQGAATLDADQVVHRLLQGDPCVIARLVQAFGDSVRGDSGAVDRARLAAIVFEDPAALARLEEVVHPRVADEIDAWLAGLPAHVAVAAVEAVKLVESGLHERLEELWLVVCEPDVRRRRLRGRGWSAAEIERRIRASPPTGPKLALATRVIENSGEVSETHSQLERAWAGLLGPSSQECNRADLD